jgi:hypothetical protein
MTAPLLPARPVAGSSDHGRASWQYPHRLPVVRASFIGRSVHSMVLRQKRRLIGAAKASGLVAEDGMRSVIATIRSGAGAGMKLLARATNKGK